MAQLVVERYPLHRHGMAEDAVLLLKDLPTSKAACRTYRVAASSTASALTVQMATAHVLTIVQAGARKPPPTAVAVVGTDYDDDDDDDDDEDGDGNQNDGDDAAAAAAAEAAAEERPDGMRMAQRFVHRLLQRCAQMDTAMAVSG